MEAILNAVERELPDMPLILGGDLNTNTSALAVFRLPERAQPSSSSLARIRSKGWTAGQSRRNSPIFFPRCPIRRAGVIRLPEQYNWYFDRQKRIGGRPALLRGEAPQQNPVQPKREEIPSGQGLAPGQPRFLRHDLIARFRRHGQQLSLGKRGRGGVTVIYIDSVFVLNALMDYLLLLCAGQETAKNSSRSRSSFSSPP